MSKAIPMLKRWWPFVALCVVAWLRSHLSDSHPELSSSLESKTLGCILAAALATAFALTRRQERVGSAGLLPAAVSGALLLCGPEAAMLLRPAYLSSSGLVIALALVPVVVVVAAGASGKTSSVSAALLWPGIAAAAGLLLLLPQPSLANALTDVTLVLSSFLTGIGCVLMCRSESGSQPQRADAALWGAALVFAAGALFYSVQNHRLPVMPGLWATIADLILAALAVLAAQRLKPQQYAARFVLLPLAIVLEGLVLVFPFLTFRSIAGTLLLAAAAVALLRDKTEDAALELFPRRE